MRTEVLTKEQEQQLDEKELARRWGDSRSAAFVYYCTYCGAPLVRNADGSRTCTACWKIRNRL